MSLNARRVLLIVFFWAALCHAPGIVADFSLDDRAFVLSHPAVNGAAPWYEVFTRDAWGRPFDKGPAILWRPLASLTYVFERQVTTAPWLPHAVNIFLFAILSCLVTAISLYYTTINTSLLVGLVFAVHPVLVESVASVASRSELLAAIFILTGVLIFKGAGLGLSSIVAMTLSYLLALLSKENSIVFPLVIGWLGLVDRRDRWRWAAMAPALVMCLMTLVYLGIRSHFGWVFPQVAYTAADNPLVDREGFLRLLGIFFVLGRYIELVIAPVRLCCDHTWADTVPPQTWSEGLVWSALGILVTAIVVRDALLAIKGRSRGLWTAAGLSYFVVGHILGPISVILAERLLLTPFCFAIVATGMTLGKKIETLNWRRLAIYAAVPLIAWSFRTVDRTLDWRDEASLFESQVITCPKAVHGRLMYAETLSRQGRTLEALWNYGLVVAARSSWPVPLAETVYDDTTDIEIRIQHLPQLVGESDKNRYFSRLAEILESLGAVREATLARQLAQ